VGFYHGIDGPNHNLEFFDQISRQAIQAIRAQPFLDKRNDVYIWIIIFIYFIIFIWKYPNELSTLYLLSTMSKRKSDFEPRVLSYKKCLYKEGKEDDVICLCSNGNLTVSNS